MSEKPLHEKKVSELFDLSEMSVGDNITFGKLQKWAIAIVKELEEPLKTEESWCMRYGCLVYPRHMEGAIRLLREKFEITEKDLK